GREEGDHPGNVDKLTQAVKRNVGEQRFQQLRIVQQLGVDGCLNRAWSDVVDGNAERRELDGQISHHHLQSAFRGAIGGEVKKGKLFVNGADVDDLAACLAIATLPCESLRGEEKTAQVDVENRVVILFGEVEETGVLFDAGVVDKDIERAKSLH